MTSSRIKALIFTAALSLSALSATFANEMSDAANIRIYIYAKSRTFGITESDLFRKYPEILDNAGRVPTLKSQIKALNDRIFMLFLDARDTAFSNFGDFISETRSEVHLDEKLLRQLLAKGFASSGNLDGVLSSYFKIFELYGFWADGMKNAAFLDEKSIRRQMPDDGFSSLLLNYLVSLYTAEFENGMKIYGAGTKDRSE